ncbi:hypothetical protein NL676_002966 [Syzygium grande]|nr:hypothetical protein NL676_002966 [Syzygium grande]
MFARLHHELEASFSKAALGKPECKDGLAVLVYFFIKFFASGCSELSAIYQHFLAAIFESEKDIRNDYLCIHQRSGARLCIMLHLVPIGKSPDLDLDVTTPPWSSDHVRGQPIEES